MPDSDLGAAVLAGYEHLIRARQDYLRARVDAFARVRPLTSRDTGGCTCGGGCGPGGPDFEEEENGDA